MDFEQFWAGLTTLNRGLYVAAAFFTVFFIWQVIAAFIGLGHDGGVDDASATPDSHDAPPDTHETVFLFKLISVRSVLAFGTLFTWASALYMSNGDMSAARSMSIGLVWGVAAMVVVGLVFNMLSKMTSVGNIQVSSCVGATASVYLDIPANGTGEIRVLCSNVMTHVKARAAAGVAMKSGTSVRVTRMLAPDVAEVEPT